MNKSNDILQAKQKLAMNLDQWERFRLMPGWVQDIHIAADYFQQPDLPFDIAELVIEEPVAWEHTDKYYISLLLNGDEARPMELDLGQGVFHRPNQPGSMIFSDGMRDKTFHGRGPYQVISLAITRSYFHSRIDELFGGKPENLDSLLISPHHDFICEQSVKRLMNVCRGQGTASKEDLLDTIIGRFWTKAGSNPQPGCRSSSQMLSRPVINHVIDYMKQNLERELSRDELAQIAGVSPGHFSRLFSSTVGHSPKRVLLILRLEQVQKLLMQSPQLSVSEIIKLCGFSDQANFYHAFRDYFGCSPARFRA